MKDKIFFEIYLNALGKALINEDTISLFSSNGPDWYIDSDETRNQIDIFEESNYEKYKSLFEKVALYFDAKSHGFNEVDGISVKEFRQDLTNEIKILKQKFDIE